VAALWQCGAPKRLAGDFREHAARPFLRRAGQCILLKLRVASRTAQRRREGNAMTLARRRFLHLTAGIAALPLATRAARADTYPSRPVHIISGFPPGGPADILGRLIGQWLSERLGQAFVVENRPGAGSNTATELVARGAADGYTLLVMTSANTINATLYDKLNYNFIRDMAPVAGFIRVPQVLEVHPSVPVNSVPEFIAYAKANPGKLSMGSAGIGTVQHVAGELFNYMTGVKIVHVPYRGQAPALLDLMAGQIQVMFDSAPASLQVIKAGKLKPLAVTTATRFDGLPDLPVLADFVPGYESSAIYGLVAPKATPADVVDRLNREINAGLADPKLKGRLTTDLGGAVLSLSPAEFGKFIADETDKWAKVIKAAGIKAE
jgi:tripartite-type tricarboxylate transporter receptor subunit TctC